MNIQNFDTLATTSLRKQALLILEAGLEAMSVPKVMQASLKFTGQKLTIAGKQLAISQFKNVVLLGLGDSGGQASQFLQEQLKGLQVKSVVVHEDGHSTPAELLIALDGLGKEDLVICCTGPGSEDVLCYPVETCDSYHMLVNALLEHGASTDEIDTVRKHTSHLLGGGLAKLCYPATVVHVVIDMAAGGPFVRDTTTVDEATRILKKYNVLDLCKMPSCKITETPKEAHFFEKVHEVLVSPSQNAVSAMRAKASDLGFKVTEGDVTSESHSRTAVLATGKYAADVLLATLPHILPDQTIVAAGLGGGVVADRLTWDRAQGLNLDARPYIGQHISQNFFDTVGDAIFLAAKPTGSGDIFVSLRQ